MVEGELPRHVAMLIECCESDSGPVQFRRAAIDALRGSIDFDAFVWVVTDPATAVGCAPLADLSGLEPEPELSALPTLIRLKYLTPVNRWTTMTSPVRTLWGSTDGDPSRSLVWTNFLSHFGVCDVLSAVFRDSRGCWGFLDLWRAGNIPFTSNDSQVLELVAPRWTAALRRSLERTFVVVGSGTRVGASVLLLSDELHVLDQSQESNEVFRPLLPPPPGHDPVPAAAYNVGAQLLAVEADVDTSQPTARVPSPVESWLTLRAARMSGPNAPIAVTIERSSPRERLDLFSRIFGLTPRESQVVARIAAGEDTRRVARTLSMTEHTVQDHLKGVFSKTDCRSRTEVVAQVVGV